MTLAYGGGGGGSPPPSCTLPAFSEESPPKDAVVPTFSEFSIIASRGTDKSIVAVKINGQPTDVVITEKRNGELLISGKLPQAITEEGFVTVSIAAASAREG